MHHAPLILDAGVRIILIFPKEYKYILTFFIN